MCDFSCSGVFLWTLVPWCLANRCLELQFCSSWIFPVISRQYPSPNLLIWFSFKLFCQIVKWLHQLVSWIYFGISFSIILLWSEVYPWCQGVFSGYSRKVTPIVKSSLLVCVFFFLLVHWDHWCWEISMGIVYWFLLSYPCGAGVVVWSSIRALFWLEPPLRSRALFSWICFYMLLHLLPCSFLRPFVLLFCRLNVLIIMCRRECLS